MEREPVVMALGRGWVRITYEAVMIALALAVVWLLTLPNEGWAWVANQAIWAVFAADYLARLAISSDRRAFLRANVPDLVAILPLDLFRLARLARLARLLRLLRAVTVLWRVSKDIRGVFGTNGLSYVLAFAVGTTAVGALAAWASEPELVTFGDALWWSIVTATTVGYGDIAPVTPLARVIAVVLMLVGIGTLGMITGSIATYFIEENRPDIDPDVEHVRERLTAWTQLEAEERRRLAAMLAALCEPEAAAVSRPFARRRGPGGSP